MVLGIGKATKIQQIDIWNISQALKVEPAVIDGIGITESNLSGWFPNGQLKILPEPHQFYHYLPASKQADALKQGIATRSYAESVSSGHYHRMTNGPGPRYALLEKWIAFDETAAYMSFSMGSFQLMGFNYKVCGFTDAKHMFTTFCDSEALQLRAFVNFVTSMQGGLKALREKDYPWIEEHYNGGGQKGAYAKQMDSNVKKAEKGRWANYHPSDDTQPAALISTSKSGPVKEVALGEISPDAEKIQERLIAWGYSIQADGNFGTLSEEALKKFQSDRSLEVTGIVDTKTRLALFEEPKLKDAIAIEQAQSPVTIVETKQTQIPVVPKGIRKPFWKSWSVAGIGTMLAGWGTSLFGGLEPWMKFVLILIGIAIGGLIVWQRQRVFAQAKAIIDQVQSYNDSDESTTVDTTVPTPIIPVMDAIQPSANS